MRPAVDIDDHRILPLGVKVCGLQQLGIQRGAVRGFQFHILALAQSVIRQVVRGSIDRGDQRPIGIQQAGHRRRIGRRKAIDQEAAVGREIERVRARLRSDSLHAAAIQVNAIELPFARVGVGGGKVEPIFLRVQLEKGIVLEDRPVQHPRAAGNLPHQLSLGRVEIDVLPAVALRNPQKLAAAFQKMGSLEGVHPVRVVFGKQHAVVPASVAPSDARPRRFGRD